MDYVEEIYNYIFIHYDVFMYGFITCILFMAFISFCDLITSISFKLLDTIKSYKLRKRIKDYVCKYNELNSCSSLNFVDEVQKTNDVNSLMDSIFCDVLKRNGYGYDFESDSYYRLTLWKRIKRLFSAE